MRPICSLPPLAVILGVRPIQAAKRLAEANWVPDPIAPTMALAVIGPTPGTVSKSLTELIIAMPGQNPAVDFGKPFVYSVKMLEQREDCLARNVRQVIFGSLGDRGSKRGQVADPNRHYDTKFGCQAPDGVGELRALTY